MSRFHDYVLRVWLGPLPRELAVAILVGILFQALVWLSKWWLQRRLKPVLLRDAADPPAARVQRRRLLLAVPTWLAAAVLYVLAVLIILRVLGMRTAAELLPLGLALAAVATVAFWRPLRDAAQGYLLLYDHLYTRGERVRLGEQEGTVVEMALRWTRLQRGDGVQVTIPHSRVGEVVNLSRTPKPPATTAPAGSGQGEGEG